MENKIELTDNSECMPVLSKMHNDKKEDNKYVLLNKYDSYYILSEKLLSILTHVFIMVCFATYFFFEYIINIEKKLFLNKIDKYFDNLNDYYIERDDEYQDIAMKYIIQHDNIHDRLYDEYKQAEEEQEDLLRQLKIKAIYMVSFVGIFFVLSLINAICIKQFIHWKHIIIENILMFTLLGIFEYLFFTWIIMNYSPISDAELQYMLYNNIEKIVNGTYG